MQQGSLLWVYEGMTQYLGNVLATRSGLKSQAGYRDLLASSAAQLDYKSGREWRPTEDTAIAASILRSNGYAWSNWRRGQDYYQEGELLWLDADTLIRQLTDDKKSLTDFLHIFLGKGGNTGPLIVTYNREELIKDLNEVVKYDWAGFLHDRVDLINPHADLEGITRGGYKLIYQDHPSESIAGYDGRRSSRWWRAERLVLARPAGRRRRHHLRRPLGQPSADKAKLAPGQKLIAIGNKAFSGEELEQAITAAKSGTEPLKFLMQSQDYITPVSIDYHDGMKYPVMVRVEGTKDYLDEITTPLVKPPTATPPATK